VKTVTSEQVKARLRVENPWWEPPRKIPTGLQSLTPRPYLDSFYRLAKDRKVRRAVVLLGPRRVGKTVLIHHAIAKLLSEGVRPERICYASVDHPLYTGLSVDALLDAYKDATAVEFTKEECFIFLDEIQYLRDWERYVKALVDRFPAVKCIASGSAAAALRLKSHESGAGRFTDFLLPPLMFYEYAVLLGKTELVSIEESAEGKISFREPLNIQAINEHFLNYLNYGGYPELAFSPEAQKDPGRFVKSDIIDKVLLRDLPSLYGIQDIPELNSLFTTLAFNTANEISLDELSKNSGVAKNTIKKYIEYLEAAFLVRVVHRVDQNARRFKRANFFKIYLTNPTIRTALFAPVGPEDEAMGAMVETAVFSQYFHSPLPLHYARWHNGEVDIVSLGPDQRASGAIEVKWSDQYFSHPEELKSLRRFCQTQHLEKAWVTTRTAQGTITMADAKFHFLPASLFCYLLGWIIIGEKLTLAHLWERI
jgi:hypothetical protein